MEEMMKTYVNCQRGNWELFFALAMVAVQMDLSKNKSSILAMEVESINATYPKFWKREDQILDVTLGTSPTRSPVTDRGGTSQIDKSFWENLTRVMGSAMGEMLQARKSQHQPTATAHYPCPFSPEILINL